MGEVRHTELGDAAESGIAAAALGACGHQLAGLVSLAALRAFFHQVGGHECFSRVAPEKRLNRPAMPWGRNSVTAMNNAPRK